MLIGHTPFEENDLLKIQQTILKGKQIVPKTISKEAKNFIKHLLIIEPKKRLGFRKNGIYDIISAHLSYFRKYENNYLQNPDIDIEEEKDPCYKLD